MVVARSGHLKEFVAGQDDRPTGEGARSRAEEHRSRGGGGGASQLRRRGGEKIENTVQHVLLGFHSSSIEDAGHEFL